MQKRRHFIKNTALLSVGAITYPKLMLGAGAEKKVRLGFIGTGARGKWLLAQVLLRPDVEVPAICDIDPEAIAAAQNIFKKSGKKTAVAYSKNETDYEQLLKRDDIDAVIVATPWEWHAPMAIAAMKAGKPVGVEVPAMVTLQEAWALVETYEKTKVPLMILENCCYWKDAMLVLNMVRQGAFGEVLHTQCGYQHDLRSEKINEQGDFGVKGHSEQRWRTQHSVDRNGDLYPTHGLGPIAKILDINTGNQFSYLTSVATASRGLHNYIVRKGGKEHPNAKINFKLGDVVTTLIKCVNGQTILISHDTNLPRPYSLNFRVQGEKGLWMEDLKSVFLEGISKEEEWDSIEKFRDTYEHPLWQKFGKQAESAGHGGIDFFVLNAFIESVKRQQPFPVDVYDAAAWSAVSALSEQSIAVGSAPVPFPDFTKEKWRDRKSIFALNQEY